MTKLNLDNPLVVLAAKIVDSLEEGYSREDKIKAIVTPVRNYIENETKVIALTIQQLNQKHYPTTIFNTEKNETN